MTLDEVRRDLEAEVKSALHNTEAVVKGALSAAVPLPNLPPKERLSLSTLEPMLGDMCLASPAPVKPTWEDIDAADADDPQAVVQYCTSIFEHLQKKELQDRVNPKYMAKQLDITEKMRTMVIDWMVEVHLKFKLLTETLFLGLNIMDRFLCFKQCPRSKLQLVCMTSLFIASKYEEVMQPSVDDLVYIAENLYSKNDILKTEEIILQALKFNLCCPTVPHFLRRFSKASRSSTKMHAIAKYLAELSMLEASMLQFLPSTIAASCVLLARLMVGSSAWTPTLEHYTGYTEEALIPCAQELYGILRKHGKKGGYEAVFSKYSSSKLNSVAQAQEVLKPIPGF